MPVQVHRQRADRLDKSMAYSLDDDGYPTPGGTTTIVYDLKARRAVSQHLSLSGTAINCAGGPTPCRPRED